MKQNLYVRTVVQRRNHLMRGLFDIALDFSSYPRLIIEVFIRKNFGERYFSLAAALTVFMALLIWPVLVYLQNVEGFAYTGWDYFLHYATWYPVAGTFLYFAILRYKEVRRNPSTFDFGKCSVYAGDILKFFWKLKLNDKTFNSRQIETILEPLSAFLIGLVLMLLAQSVGIFIMVVAVIYSLSYVGAYKRGDDFILNKIDEILHNQELENAFVHNKRPEDCRGVRYYMKKPDDINMRSELAGEMIFEDAPTFAI